MNFSLDLESMAYNYCRAADFDGSIFMRFSGDKVDLRGRAFDRPILIFCDQPIVWVCADKIKCPSLTIIAYSGRRGPKWGFVRPWSCGRTIKRLTSQYIKDRGKSVAPGYFLSVKDGEFQDA